MKSRKILCVLLTALFMLSSLTVALASETVSVELDGNPIAFDVSPQLIGGRTMVPLRAIFEALGATVSWDDPTQTVTAYNEVNIVKCTIGSNTMYVNNVAKSIDVPPMLVDSRTLVPARFIAEAFGCEVQWNPDTFVVSITSADIDYTQVEKDTSVESQPSQNVDNSTNAGTLSNPYSATAGETVTYHEWSFEPVRKVAITCNNVIRGTTANTLANSENMFNDKPSGDQEWIFFEFNVKYISSEDGSDDVLKGSDVIYKDLLFTTSGAAVPVCDTATLGDKYKGYGVFDVELYPGASSKVVLGVLTEKGLGDILLKIPNKGENTNSWINCTKGVGSTSSSSSSSSGTTTKPSTSTTSSYYTGTTLPTYTSVTGVRLKGQTTLSDGAPVYMYTYTNADAVGMYWKSLLLNGWKSLKGDDTKTITTYESSYYKGSDIVIVNVYLDTMEVWITYDGTLY